MEERVPPEGQPAPSQKTQPRGKDKQGRRHKPVDIPIPTREEVFDLMRGVIGKRSGPHDSGSKQ
jgi:hypothetical protein